MPDFSRVRIDQRPDARRLVPPAIFRAAGVPAAVLAIHARASAASQELSRSRDLTAREGEGLAVASATTEMKQSGKDSSQETKSSEPKQSPVHWLLKENTTLLTDPRQDATLYHPDGSVIWKQLSLRDAKDKPKKDEAGKKLPDLAGGTVVRVGKAKKIAGHQCIHLPEYDAWVRASGVQTTAATLPQGTEVIPLEKQGGYMKIKSDEGEHWTQSSNLDLFDTKYATTFGDEDKKGKELTAGAAKGMLKQVGKQTNLRYEQDGTAKETSISANAISALGAVAGKIVPTGASSQDPSTWSMAKPRVELGGGRVVLILKEEVHAIKDAKGGSAKGTFVQVEDLETGVKHWILSKLIKALDRKQLEAEIKDPGQRERLQQVYQGKVTSLLDTRKYTENQQELLKAAQDFVASPKTDDKWRLVIPAGARAEAGETLSADLMNRMGAFYSFIGQQGLISGPFSSISGIRAKSVAHELSVRWMFNQKSKALLRGENQWKLAQNLIELEGKDGATDQVWANESQLARLRAAAAKYGSFGEMKVAAGSKAADAATKTIYTDFLAALGEMQQTHGTQEAQAAEGYAKDLPERRPNILDAGISRHCGGEAIDVFFPWKFNYYDPIIDAIAARFGLMRPVKDSSQSPEYWHYERVGVAMGERQASWFEPDLVRRV